MLSPVGRNVQFCRDYYGLPLSGIGQITKALAWSTFYRMMLCILHSVDYAVAKSPSVCPSVCLFVCSSVSVSHVRRYCAEMAKRIVKLFQLGYPHHSSFFHSSFPTETFYRGGRRMQGGTKNADFRPISLFISKIIQDRAIVIMKPYPSYYYK